MFASRLGHQLLPTQWRPEQRASTLRQTFQEVEMRRQTSCPPTTYSIAQVLLTCMSSETNILVCRHRMAKCFQAGFRQESSYKSDRFQIGSQDVAAPNILP
jgi:hypothetical protein